VIGSSHKGLMCPPGLSFTAIGPRALAAARRGLRPLGYWSWSQRLDDGIYRRFCGTPPVQQLFALDEALTMIAEEGIGPRLARHERFAGAVRAAVEAWTEDSAVEFSARQPAERSNSVTAVMIPDGFSAAELRTVARDRFGVTVGPGMGPNGARSMRIGHLGDLNEPMILGALGGLELALRHQGIPHGRGALDAAVSHLGER
jgi:alanine-glyoxylate transaminase/serine-glyoxylate transaminase/serine-pyruvate transaminase